jgi:hypothetical protein
LAFGGPISDAARGASATVRDIGHSGAVSMWCSRMRAFSAVTASFGPVRWRGMLRCCCHAHTSVSSEAACLMTGGYLLYNLSTE